MATTEKTRIYIHGIHALSARDTADYIVFKARGLWHVTDAATGRIFDTVATLARVAISIDTYPRFSRPPR